MSEDGGAREMVILSAAGIVIVLTLAWFGGFTADGARPADRWVVVIPLLSSFVIGISLAARPGWMKRLRRDAVHSADSRPHDPQSRVRQGHHPDCEYFASHTVRIGGKIFCAGCAGLTVGSGASIALALLYISFPIGISTNTSLLAAWIGTALVAVSMADSELLQAQGSGRLASNAVMPIGFFLVAVGLLESTGNATYALMGIVISFLWLDTRIRLSRRRHIRMCRSCHEACKSYLV